MHAAGLETFGIKLAEASKLFGKKFASGASITKNAMEKDQIEARMPNTLFHCTTIAICPTICCAGCMPCQIAVVLHTKPQQAQA